MNPARPTRRHPDSPRVQELLDAMRSSPLQSRDGLLLIACLLMLRLIDQRERDLQAVAEFDGRRYVSDLPEPDLWQRLVSQTPDNVGGFLGRISSQLLRRSSSSGTPIQFLVATLDNLFHSARQEESLAPKPRLAVEIVQLINSFDLSDQVSRNSAAELFEDLLGRFTRSEKYSGQFTTPPDLCRFMVDIAAPKPGERIYDPCLGMGGLLVTAARRLQESQSSLAPAAWAELQENSIFGIELQPDLCLLATVRLMLAGITTPRIECGDTLEREPGQRGGSLGFDCILAQPPFGQKLERAVSSQYRISSSSGENLFLQHILGSLRPGGRAVVLVSEGLLYRGGAEEHLRKLLLNEYRVNAVVSLPAGAMMPYTSVKTSLLVIQRLPPRSAVWFVQDEITSKLLIQAEPSSPGYSMLVSALQASQQEGTADSKLRREVEQIVASQAEVFHRERNELERRRAELGHEQAVQRDRLMQLHKKEENLKNFESVMTSLGENRQMIENNIPECQQELARSQSELADIQSEKPVTEHGKRILERRIHKLTSTIEACEERMTLSQKQLATIDARIRKSESAARNVGPQIAANHAEITLAKQKILEMAEQTSEVERRLADIYSGAQDWEVVQGLSGIAQFFLSYRADDINASGHLPSTVMPTSRLAGKNWELVFKGGAIETSGEFIQNFSQSVPQTQVMTLGDLADVSRGRLYSRDRDDAPVRKSSEIRQYIKTVRIQDLPKDTDADAEGIPLIDLTSSKIIEGAVRSPRETDFLRPSDIVLSVGGTVGRVAIIGDTAAKAVASNGLVVIRCHNVITPQYLAALLRTEPYQHLLAESSSGTSIRHLSAGTLRQIPIPLPPLEVQQRLSAMLRPGQSVESVLSLVSTRPTAVNLMDSIFEDHVLKQWADLPNIQLYFPSGGGKSQFLSRTLSKSQTWSKLLESESRRDPTAAFLTAWIDAVRDYAETQELRRDADRWAAMQAWFNHFNDERGQFANAFRKLREIRNRAAHGFEPVDDPGMFSKYGLLEKLRDSLRFIWEQESKTLAGQTKLVGSVSPAILTVGVESELTFTVRNEGALPLRRIDLATKPFDSSASCASLSPMEEHRWTLKLKPHEAGKFDIKVKWSALQMDRTGFTDEFSLGIEVRTLREQSLLHRLDTSPYITGTSLSARDGALFFGRTDILTEIKRSLRTSGPSTVLILEGVRRVGKTSLLKQLLRPEFLPKWICVYYNFQGATGAQDKHGVPTGTIFYGVTKEIVFACHAAGIEFDVPRIGLVQPSMRKQDLMAKMYETLRPAFEQSTAPFELLQMAMGSLIQSLGDNRLLLLLDEFDKVQVGIESGVTSPQVPDNFRDLFHSYPQVSAILTGSQLMKRLRREYFNPLFGIGRQIDIGPLDPAAARELVVKPVQGSLIYGDAARDWIVEACACQPFLIQHVCNRVFDICADSKEANVTTDTARKAAEMLLKTDTHFDTVWRDDIHDPRRQYVAWLIYELQSGPDPVTFDLIRQVLEKRGLYGSTALTGYLQDLRDLAVIRQQEKDRMHTYSIAIPLFAEWLRVRIDQAQYLTKAVNEDGGKL